MLRASSRETEGLGRPSEPAGLAERALPPAETHASPSAMPHASVAPLLAELAAGPLPPRRVVDDHAPALADDAAPRVATGRTGRRASAARPVWRRAIGTRRRRDVHVGVRTGVRETRERDEQRDEDARRVHAERTTPTGETFPGFGRIPRRRVHGATSASSRRVESLGLPQERAPRMPKPWRRTTKPLGRVRRGERRFLTPFDDLTRRSARSIAISVGSGTPARSLTSARRGARSSSPAAVPPRPRSERAGAGARCRTPGSERTRRWARR